MLERRVSINVAEAVERVLEYPIPIQSELVTINESHERFLYDDIVATNDVPHFDRAPVDGYAIRAIDSKFAAATNPIEFKVIDHIGAGMVSKVKVGPFEAIRIMTGAQMPIECDTVVMLELSSEIERNGQKYMVIKRSFKEGDNISYSGEDAKKGDILVDRGTYINPGIQAVLATFGHYQLKVARKPVIGLFTTGNELLNVRDPLVPGKIRNSNANMISAQIDRVGAVVKDYGSLPDNIETCYKRIRQALDEVDVLITTGGVSVGDFDYMPIIYENLEAEILFNKVSMRPGSITTVAQLKGKLLFGLSGNPSACYVGFELFVRPVIRRALLSSKPHLRKEVAVLEQDLPKPNPFTRFVRSVYTIQNGTLVVRPSGVDKSNIIMSLIGVNCLIVLPGGTRGFKKGTTVEVLLLEDLIGSEWPW